jgi:protein-tyrosine kinase
MSLFEQAIARMKDQARAAPTAAEGASKPVTPTILNRQTDPAARSAQGTTLDMGSLRAQGYLPEAGRDRHFADHYRRIKGPLIEKATAGITGAADPRVIMITSALPGDGKTFTSINLALSMALERDISVLLVDCDVAKRHVSDVLGFKEESGLLDALVDESMDIESLVVQTNVHGLSILPSGRRAEATPELLSSNRMRQIVANLCASNPRRILLLDSPPLLITNEGRTLLKIAGQVALVVRAGHTPRQAVQDAIGLIEPQQAGGIVLNQVKVTRVASYYGYGEYGMGHDAT